MRWADLFGSRYRGAMLAGCGLAVISALGASGLLSAASATQSRTQLACVGQPAPALVANARHAVNSSAVAAW